MSSLVVATNLGAFGQRDWHTDYLCVGDRKHYYEPEDLGHEQQRRDAADPNRRFYVYVLKTSNTATT